MMTRQHIAQILQSKDAIDALYCKVRVKLVSRITAQHGLMKDTYSQLILVDEPGNDELSVEKRQRCPTVTFPCSRMRTVCANMRNAIRRGRPTQLNRITSRSQIARNRRLSGCPRLPRRPGFNCDEYPFASSRQGTVFTCIKQFVLEFTLIGRKR